MAFIIGTVIAVAGVLIPVWFWIDGKIFQVRTYDQKLF